MDFYLTILLEAIWFITIQRKEKGSLYLFIGEICQEELSFQF